jgi:hypothetical protein
MSHAGFSFRPHVEGEVQVDLVPDDFWERMERRIANGLLVPGERSRANYRVVTKTSGALEFEAVGFLTEYAIGLNRVQLRRTSRATIAYVVDFPRWTRDAVLHGLILGAAIGGACLLPDVRRQLAAYPGGLQILGGMLAFWCLAWPWILTAIHRPFAARALERILHEELAGAAPARKTA